MSFVEAFCFKKSALKRASGIATWGVAWRKQGLKGDMKALMLRVGLLGAERPRGPTVRCGPYSQVWANHQPILQVNIRQLQQPGTIPAYGVCVGPTQGHASAMEKKGVSLSRAG